MSNKYRLRYDKETQEILVAEFESDVAEFIIHHADKGHHENKIDRATGKECLVFVFDYDSKVTIATTEIFIWRGSQMWPPRQDR